LRDRNGRVIKGRRREWKIDVRGKLGDEFAECVDVIEDIAVIT
jgi:hypothetical protein